MAGRGSKSSLDNAAFAGCASPKSYSNLPDGSHAFEVRATDTAGNVEATPASRTLTVDTTATRVLGEAGRIGAAFTVPMRSVPRQPLIAAVMNTTTVQLQAGRVENRRLAPSLTLDTLMD